jgi:hypothetical protein
MCESDCGSDCASCVGAHPEAAHGVSRATPTRSVRVKAFGLHHCRKECDRGEDTYLLSDGLWLTKEAVNRNFIFA